MRFPDCIARIICGYASTWRLLPWVASLMVEREKYLTEIMHCLWANPRGLNECFDRNLPMNWEKLCLNPHPWAVEQIMKTPGHGVLCYDNMIRNPGLRWVPLTLTYWDICSNPGNRTTEYVIARLRADPSIISGHISMLCLNSNDLAVDFILDQCPTREILKSAWSNSNPRMFEMLQRDYSDSVVFTELSANSHPAAIEMLKNAPRQIHWCSFLMNPGIFEARCDPGMFAILIGAV